jgi:hypothetical protein
MGGDLTEGAGRIIATDEVDVVTSNTPILQVCGEKLKARKVLGVINADYSL